MTVGVRDVHVAGSVGRETPRIRTELAVAGAHTAPVPDHLVRRCRRGSLHARLCLPTRLSPTALTVQIATSTSTAIATRPSRLFITRLLS